MKNIQKSVVLYSNVQCKQTTCDRLNFFYFFSCVGHSLGLLKKGYVIAPTRARETLLNYFIDYFTKFEITSIIEDIGRGRERESQNLP